MAPKNKWQQLTAEQRAKIREWRDSKMPFREIRERMLPEFGIQLAIPTLHYYLEKRQKPKKSIGRLEYSGELFRMQDCLCPRCGETHRKKTDYTGRGMPRIFCTGCASDLENEVNYAPEQHKSHVLKDGFFRARRA